MSNRYRGTIYVGITADLAARVSQHRQGKGSKFCAEHNLNRLVWAEFIEPIDNSITHEKRVKRWHRDWKIALIERANPEWCDLFENLNC